MADVVFRLGCEWIVVAANKLGTINHTLLTVKYLQHMNSLRKKHRENLKVVLMDSAKCDESSGSNGEILRELLSPVPLLQMPFLGRNACSVATVKKSRKKIAKTLASIFE